MFLMTFDARTPNLEPRLEREEELEMRELRLRAQLYRAMVRLEGMAGSETVMTRNMTKNDGEIE